MAAFLAAAALVLLPAAAPAGGPGPGGIPAAAAGSAEARWQPRWQWPLEPEPRVLRAFQRPAQRWLAGHRGVDLASPAGAVVLSPAAGTVHFAGWVVDRPVLTLRFEEDGEVLLSSFEPVEATVPVGSAVSPGQPVGVVRSVEARHCPELCLHWGVREGGEYVDPLAFVTDRRPSVLLPVTAAAAGRIAGRSGRPP